MLSRFFLENYLSFKGPHELSFNYESSAAKIFKENTLFEYKEFNKKRVILNGLIILGANASGKSNILHAMSSLRNLYLKSFDYNTFEDIDEEIEGFSLCDTKDNLITKLGTEIIRSLNGIDYKITYEINIDSETQKINSEKLFYNKILKSTVSAPKIIFERVSEKITNYSESLSQIISKIEKENIEYKAILSLLNFDLNKNFFKEEMDSLDYEISYSLGRFLELNFSIAEPAPGFEDFSEKLLANSDFKQYVLDSLYDFDFSISDFSLIDISDDFLKSLEESGLLNGAPENVKKQILSDFKKNKQYKIEALHKVDGKNYPISLGMESNGTRKFLRNSFRIYEALFSEKLYVEDEFDSKYHFNIQQGIIKKFLENHHTGLKRSQFLIVSHNPLLLNPDYFAKEQIIFVEKNRATQESENFNLSDFKEITYNNHNWMNMYLNGRFGAVPEVII